MNSLSPQFLLFLETMILMPAVLLHLTKKNTVAVWLYVVQGLALALLLFFSSLGEISVLLAITLAATILVKIFIAPTFFFRLIKRHQLKFSASTYLSTPLTLFTIALVMMLTQNIFSELISALAPSQQSSLFISAASIFVSLFLLINRKGVLSQMLGILSLENSIVSFAIFAGLEQNPGLQLGIIFDILIWTVIATIFASMIYHHFGSLDVTKMKRLTES